MGAHEPRGARVRRRGRGDGARRRRTPPIASQFGQPIGTFESLIRLRDDALTTAAAAKLLALHAAWQLDTKHVQAHDTASRARVIAGDAVTRATIDAVQIFGGYGFVNDYPVEKLMRDARAFEALHGDERLGRVLAQKGA